jgi:hypothetical protein
VSGRRRAIRPSGAKPGSDCAALPPLAAGARGRRARLRALWLCVLAGSACSHDLAKLRGRQAAAGSDAPDAAVLIAGAGGAADNLASCQPCEPANGLSELVTPEACCTGAKDAQCGVSLSAAGRCFARNSPGLSDTTCPDLMRAGARFAGCCRFDEQCGVSVDALGLGCLARDEVPVLLGGPLAARACVPTCDGDRACATLLDVSVCVEDATHRPEARYCGYSCKSDKDCAALPGTVCGIQQNKTDQRIDAVCRKAFGPGLLGDACVTTTDCAHGVCLDAPGARYCSQLCRTDLDCEGIGTQCKISTIQLPAPGAGTQPFNICVAKK